MSGESLIDLPEDEVKVGKGQHNDSEKRRHGTMKNGFEHMLEGNHDAVIFVANARYEALKLNKVIIEVRLTSC